MAGTRQKPSSKTSSAKQVHSAPTRAPSFLFVVNEVQVNDDPDSGGVIPRVSEEGRWLPPTSSAGFWPQQLPGTVFRWNDGEISAANGYQWYNGNGWGPGNIQLTEYRSTTMFYSNPWTQHFTANGDATTRNMATSPFPDHRWWPLTFIHDGTISRITEGADQQYLAGTGANWINQLGLQACDDLQSPPTGGLAGNLPTVIALMAFSCRHGQFDNILLHDRAWRGRRWRGHVRPHGHIEQRGVVATVYLDPQNSAGSTSANLYSLEWVDGPLVR